MKNMKYRLGTLLLLLSFCSCSNIFNKDVSKTKDSKTYVMITSDNVSVRTVSPTQEYALEQLTSITLSAKKTGYSSRILANSLAKISDLYKCQFLLEDGAGSYTFELQGSIDGIWFYDKQQNVQIEESKMNTVTFELAPAKDRNNLTIPFDDFGGINFTLNFDETNVDKIHYNLQNWDDDDNDWAIVDQGDITDVNSGKATYSRLVKNTSGDNARLPAGQYRLIFDFLTKDTSLNAYLPINSFPYIVNVVSGRNTTMDETVDLNPVYTIEYNDDGGSLVTGYMKQTKFTHNDEVYLPDMCKDGYTFMGWYTTSTFVDSENNPSGPIYMFDMDTHEDQILYARFESSTIYVNSTSGNNNNDGSSSDKAFKTINAALDKIKNITTTDQSEWRDWYIFLSGSFNESLDISVNDEMALSFNARSITLLGATGLSNGVPQDIIQGDGTNPVLTVLTTTEIKLKNVKITGGKDSQGYNGGGILVRNQSNVTIEDGTLITGNTASTNGGGIAVYNNATLWLAGGTIQGNTLSNPDKYGAGVYCGSGGIIKVSGSPVVDEIVISDIPDNESSMGAITLADNLSAGASITITPEDYEYNNTPRMYYSSLFKSRYVYTMSEEYIKIEDNMEYFHLTPQEGSLREWYLDDEGCLIYDCKVTFTENGSPIGSTATIPFGSSIFKDDTRFSTPTKTGYVFAGWVYKKQISNSPVTYDARMFVFDSEYISEVTYITEDMELMPAWICDSNTLYVNPTSGINFVEYDDANDEILFADGSADHPYDSIDTALEAICIRNNSNIDYTIAIDGMTEEYNITIDDTIPAKSITLQGKNEPAAGADPVDGILHGDGMYSNQHNPYQSLLLVSTSTPVILQNIKIDMNVQGYYVDGAALAISSGEVTLEAGATFVGSNDSSIPQGAIAVGDGASLVMNEGALIKGFGIEKGAVYVKTGGSFTMNGGIIKDNKIGDSGAVHVGGGEFIMNGGSISGNTTRALGEVGNTDDKYGAGVCVVSGTFTMNGGYITNNKAYVYNSSTGLTTAGGGVFVYSNGTFVMTGGEISGNAAIKANIASPETIIDGDYAYGGGVCLQAKENKVASFTMTGGTISGNTAGTSGNGIGFIGSLNEGKTGTIYLGDEALITPDNDVYLPSFMTITIVSSIMDDNDNPIKATITPQEYKANQPIFDEAGVNLAVETSYFAITPQIVEGVTTNWLISTEGKLYKHMVGDLLLQDGSFVYYDENHTFTTDEVSNAVGLVYGLDSVGKPAGILGLQNYWGAWAPQYTTGYETKFEEIICTPDTYSANDATFEGDIDGSDNWERICDIDTVGTDDPATYYPAFNYAINYAATVGLTKTDYEDGWYIPSIAELACIKKNLTTINSVLTKIKAADSTAAETLSSYYYWSSSQCDSDACVWYINTSNETPDIISSNKDWDSPGYCCIRKY